MFGLAARGRLAMYRSTLQQAIVDADGTVLFHGMALMTAFLHLGNTTNHVAGRRGVFEYLPTVQATIENIPARYVSNVDGILVQTVSRPRFGEPQHLYQMETLLNGLIFVRVLEVTRPSLQSKAYAYQAAALTFAEPLYLFGMQAMLSAEKDVG